MCLLIVASRVVAGTPLLIAANRDEFLSRPASPFSVLSGEGPRILGGQDQQAGGTWLAVNEHGVFAGLTNQPLGENRDPNRRSRGELPLALAAHRTASEATNRFLEQFSASDYNGCWLLVGDRRSLFFIDFTGLVPTEAVALSPGVHVLENRTIDSPSPKADHVRATLPPFIGSWEQDRAALISVLSDHAIPEVTGDGPNASANCVHLDNYGTRSSCIIGMEASESTTPECWVADGPPCTTPFVNFSSLWTRDPR